MTAIKLEGERLLQTQSEAVKSAVLSASLDIADGSLAPEALVETLQAEMARLAEMIQARDAAAEVNLAPVVETIQRESALLTESLSSMLHSALAETVNQDGGGNISLEPVLTEIRESGDRIMERLGATTIPQDLAQTIRKENEELLERLTMQGTMGPIIEALETQGEIIAKQQTESLRATVSEIMVTGGDALALERVMDTVRTEGANIVAQIAEKFSMSPILQAVEEYLDKITFNQFQTLYDTLAEVAARYADGQMNIEPIVESIRLEGERISEKLTEQMSGATILEAVRSEIERNIKIHTTQLEEAIAGIEDKGGATYDPEPLLQEIKSQRAGLAEELAGQFDVTPVLDAVRQESTRLLKGQTELFHEMVKQDSGDAMDLAPVLAAIQEESRRLGLELKENISLAPILADIKDETTRTIRNQSEDLRKAVQQMARDARQEFDHEPILAAIQAESRRLAQELSNNAITDNHNQIQTIKRVIDEAFGKLRRDLTPEELLKTVKTESNRIATTLEQVVIPKIETVKRTPQPVAPAPISPEMVKSAVKSETARLEGLLHRNLQAAKAQPPTAPVAKSSPPVQQSPKPQPAKPAPKPLQPQPVKPAVQTTPIAQKPVLKPSPTPQPSAPTKKRTGWMLTKPGEQYSDIVGQAGKPLSVRPVRTKMAKEIHWEPIGVGPKVETQYKMPPSDKRDALAGLQGLMAKITPATVTEIDGASLLELMQSMKLYLSEQFGEQSGYLNAAIQELIDKIAGGTPISEPTVIKLLREIGDRSNLIMTSYNPDVPRVAKLDNGFLKTAKALQKQVDELAVSRQGIKSRRTATLSASLDPDNSRQELFHQFIEKQRIQLPEETRTKRLDELEANAGADTVQKPQTPVTTAPPAPTVSVAKVVAAPQKPLPLTPKVPTPAKTQAIAMPHLDEPKLTEKAKPADGAGFDKWDLPSISNTRTFSRKSQENFFNSFLKRRHGDEENGAG